MVEAHVEEGGESRENAWRIVGWSAVALVLVAPLVAMQFTDEVNWTGIDFVFAAGLLITVGGLFELAMRKSGDVAYRAAIGVALAAALLLVWVNGAVGIIGSEDNDANLMYAGVLAIGITGALLARFRSRGMAWAMAAASAAQAVVAGIAIVGGLGAPYTEPWELLLLNGFFVVLFAGAAMLFQEAAARSPAKSQS